jgi:nitroreductase
MRLGLPADDLLTTTRAVRKRLDLTRAVPLEVVHELIEIAVQAPTGSNRQGWHWMVVTDPAKRAAVAERYAAAFAAYRASGLSQVDAGGDGAREATQQRVSASSQYLADHMAEVPVLVIPCLEGRVDDVPGWVSASLWGSLFPAAWSFMLAARERGMGTSWTTLHLMYEQEVAEILGIPFERYAQGLLIPLAYTKGTDFKLAPRIDLEPLIHVDEW